MGDGVDFFGGLVVLALGFVEIGIAIKGIKEQWDDLCNTYQPSSTPHKVILQSKLNA